MLGEMLCQTLHVVSSPTSSGVLLMLVSCLETLPNHVHLWIESTVERLMVLVSLVLNAIVCLLFVKTWKIPPKPKKLDEEHVAYIHKFITEHSKTLTTDDFEGDSDPNTNEDEDSPGWILVPKSGQKIMSVVDEDMQQQQQQQEHPGTGCQTQQPHQQPQQLELRSAFGECAICMLYYTVGDNVVWSSNSKCIHVFHAECLRSWLLPWEDRNQLCPCCRQSYCCSSSSSSTTTTTTTTTATATTTTESS